MFFNRKAQNVVSSCGCDGTSDGLRCSRQGDLSCEETAATAAAAVENASLGSAARPAMPLSLAHPGEALVVRRVRGSQEVCRHLRELGLVDGVPVRVVSASSSNMIVQVKGANLGLDASVAQHVYAA